MYVCLCLLSCLSAYVLLVPMSSDHIEQTPSVSSLVASPGPSSDPFTPDIKVHVYVHRWWMKLRLFQYTTLMYIYVGTDMYIHTYVCTYVRTPILCKLGLYFVSVSECDSSLNYWWNEESHSHDKWTETGSFWFQINSGDNRSEAGTDQSDTARSSLQHHHFRIQSSNTAPGPFTNITTTDHPRGTHPASVSTTCIDTSWERSTQYHGCA